MHPVIYSSDVCFCVVTLKNSAELLEFAVMYNAEQLKLSCLQFIVLNITALLESKWVVFHPLDLKSK